MAGATYENPHPRARTRRSLVRRRELTRDIRGDERHRDGTGLNPEGAESEGGVMCRAAGFAYSRRFVASFIPGPGIKKVRRCLIGRRPRHFSRR